VAETGDLIRLRYPARCSSCAIELPRGSRARWHRGSRTATCEACTTVDAPAAAAQIEHGGPGASAAREWQRRHERREADVREQYGKLAGLILALSDDPRSTSAWAKGARGEQIIGENLNKFRDQGFAVLHDRRIPGSKANIDHIVISHAGVFVIDTKHYKGRVEQRDVGGWLTTDLRLFVGGRDRSKLLAGIARQVEVVHEVLATDGALKDVPITGALLFMADDNWPLLSFKPLRFGAIYVLWGKALGKLIRAEPDGPADDVALLEVALARALPPA
jgi:hypothetical protein